jgi:hypothetical protein
MLLVAALVAVCAALYLSSQRNLTKESQVRSLLPTLSKELNTVTAMSVRKGGATPTLTVHKVGEQWTVAERGDYPADVAKLRKLLVALGDARIAEEKTSNPQNFSIIGVEDPTQAGATGAELTVVAQDGKHAVIVGKAAGEGTFARLSGENQSYIVEPAISVESEPRLWIDSRLIDLPAASIQSVEVKPAAGPGYVIRRVNPKEESFNLEGAPAGRKPLDSHALAPSSNTLSGLTAEDVAPVKDVDFSKSAQAIITLSDGNVITVIGAPLADKHWIQLTASKDAALDAKTKDRAFDVASYRYDAIFRPVEQLLVPKEPPAPAKGTAPGNKPSSDAKAKGTAGPKAAPPGATAAPAREPTPAPAS